jgi:AcrR family transcriptional regulator
MNSDNSAANPPRGTRRKAQKAATARAILAAAREEFERVGFEGANLRAIAATAGVSAASVVHHFGDKRELLYAALDEGLSAAIADAIETAPVGRAAGRMSALTRTVMGFYEERPALSRALLKESLFADGVWRERFNAQTAGVHACVAAWLDDARMSGEVADTFDPMLGAAAYLSFFYFGLLGWAQGAIAAPAVFVDRLVAQHLGAGPASSPPPLRSDR